MNTATSTFRRLSRPRRALGLGLAELLIALTIMALLLTSVAAAFHASCKTVEENQKVTTVTHNARIVLNRMMAQLRPSLLINWDKHSDTPDPEYMTSVEFAPADDPGPNVVKYEFKDGILYYSETHGTLKTYVILGGDEGVTVHDFSVGYEGVVLTDEDTGEDYTLVTFVTADLDIEVDGNRLMVSSSTIPRLSREW